MSLMNISIKRFYLMIISITFVLLIIILALSIYAGHRRSLIYESGVFRDDALKIAQELEASSVDLTRLARLYTATGKPKFKDYYYKVLGIRNGTFPRPNNYSSRYWDYVLGGSLPENNAGKIESFRNQLNKLNLTQYEQSLLDLAHERSNELTKLEIRAFNAMSGLFQDSNGEYTVQGKPDQALSIRLLSGNEYLQAKNKIMIPIGQFIQSIDARTKNQILKLQTNQRYGLMLLIIMIVICLVLVTFALYALIQHLRQIDKLLLHADNIKKNNYSARNNLNSENELGILGNTLNQMCESVDSNIREHEILAKHLRESEEHFRLLIENSPYGFAIVTLEGKFVQVNNAFCKYFGFTTNELLRMGYQDLTDPKDLLIEEKLIKHLIEGNIPSYTMDKIYIRQDGTKAWFNLSVTLIKDEAGKPVNLVGQVIDITDRKNNETTLVELSSRMSDTLKNLRQREHEEFLLNKLNESLQLCMTLNETFPRIKIIALEFFPDLSGGISIYNNESKKLETKLEWGKDQILTKIFSTLDCFALRRGSANIVDDPAKAIPCDHYQSPPKGGYIGVPLIVLGEIIGVIHLFAAIGKKISKSEQQVIISFCNVIKLALSNIKLLEALHEQSIHDPLTGLYNRRYLDEALQNELLRCLRNKSTVCVAMLDLDFFKHFNDNYGHEAGDLVLTFLGKLLEKNFRGSDLACRFGGEEFIVVLPDTDLKTASSRLEKIRVEVKNSELKFHNEMLSSITVSIGLAVAPEHGTTADAIILAADQAMYVAKQSGRDRTVVFDIKAKDIHNEKNS